MFRLPTNNNYHWKIAGSQLLLAHLNTLTFIPCSNEKKLCTEKINITEAFFLMVLAIIEAQLGN